MTLSTLVAITAPVDATEIHAWANRELLRAPDAEHSVGSGEIANAPGQGLDAWLITRHNDGAPINWRQILYVPDEKPDYEDDDDYARECARADAMAEAWAVLDFDTAYGYVSDGKDCGGLHAEYIARICQKVGPEHVRWQNEFTGEWHDGLDGLADLGRGAAQAVDWFHTTALPAIIADIEAAQR